MTTLGVDPGKGGGAGVIRDGVVRGWWAWTKVRGGFRVRSAWLGPVTLASQHAIGQYIIQTAPTGRVVLEKHFVARGSTKAAKGKRRSLITLCEATGEILGPLRALDPDPLRPTADTWRAAMLGVKGMSAAYCEERAVAWATEQLLWAPGAEGLFRGLTMAEEGAVCEALCMAVWGEERG